MRAANTQPPRDSGHPLCGRAGRWSSSTCRHGPDSLTHFWGLGSPPTAQGIQRWDTKTQWGPLQVRDWTQPQTVGAQMSKTAPQVSGVGCHLPLSSAHMAVTWTGTHHCPPSTQGPFSTGEAETRAQGHAGPGTQCWPPGTGIQGAGTGGAHTGWGQCPGVLPAEQSPQGHPPKQHGKEGVQASIEVLGRTEGSTAGSRSGDLEEDTAPPGRPGEDTVAPPNCSTSFSSPTHCLLSSSSCSPEAVRGRQEGFRWGRWGTPKI